MIESIRRNLLSKPIFQWAKGSLPSLSATEREAMEAGDTWWDADLFSGAPDWEKMRDMAPASLTEEEQAFIDGPVAELCDMLDDWQIASVDMDLPPEVWEFLKKNRFFGMIIPKEYGGLGFSAFAHSEVNKRISSRSVTAAVTVMVPNSLGPGELLMQFGLDEQKDHYLPRLADGREIPCFALTSNEAGSDASAMIDRGVVCKRTVDGKEVLGISITFAKRYITLAPVATVLGLAFKLFDPDHLLSDVEDRGITVALVPTDTPGVEHGRRHIPSMQAFQNGPVTGKDVFVPFDRNHRRARPDRAGLEDADGRAGGRAGHFAAFAGDRGGVSGRADGGRLFAHPRAVRHSHRQVRRDQGTARPDRGHRLRA